MIKISIVIAALDLSYNIFKRRKTLFIHIEFLFWCIIYVLIGKNKNHLRTKPKYQIIVEQDDINYKKQYNCIKNFLIEHKIYTKMDIERLIYEFSQNNKSKPNIIGTIFSVIISIFPLFLNDQGLPNDIQITNTFASLGAVLIIVFFIYIYFKLCKDFWYGARGKMALNEEIINILSELYYECKK